MNQVNIVITGLLSKSVLTNVCFMTSSEELKSVSYILTSSSNSPGRFQLITSLLVSHRGLKTTGDFPKATRGQGGVAGPQTQVCRLHTHFSHVFQGLPQEFMVYFS